MLQHDKNISSIHINKLSITYITTHDTQVPHTSLKQLLKKHPFLNIPIFYRIPPKNNIFPLIFPTIIGLTHIPFYHHPSFLLEHQFRFILLFITFIFNICMYILRTWWLLSWCMAWSGLYMKCWCWCWLMRLMWWMGSWGWDGVGLGWLFRMLFVWIHFFFALNCIIIVIFIFWQKLIYR